MKLRSITEIIDERLEWMKEEFFPMTAIEGTVPDEMIDETMEAEEDYVGWKAIQSTVSDEDIVVFEEKINCNLPTSYKAFLQYKYFYQLYMEDSAIQFPQLLPQHKLGTLEKQIFEYFLPERIIGKGYVYFADFRDFGLLVFDTSKSLPDHEYRVLYMDHDELDTTIPYADSFLDLMNSDENRSNRFIEEVLNKR